MQDETKSGSDKKIFIDEDWKSRAQAEKEELSRKRDESPGSQAATEAQRPHEQADRTEGRRGPMPPASFPFLVSTLSTQALISLGAVENPFTGKAERDLDQAKHFIDTLEMLQEKTRGNLSSQEQAMLDNVLYELRLAYVESTSQPAAQNP
jgi:hypothetical protein